MATLVFGLWPWSLVLVLAFAAALQTLPFETYFWALGVLWSQIGRMVTMHVWLKIQFESNKRPCLPFGFGYFATLLKICTSVFLVQFRLLASLCIVLAGVLLNLTPPVAEYALAVACHIWQPTFPCLGKGGLDCLWHHHLPYRAYGLFCPIWNRLCPFIQLVGCNVDDCQCQALIWRVI